MRRPARHPVLAASLWAAATLPLAFVALLAAGIILPRVPLRIALERQFAPFPVTLGDVGWSGFGNLDVRNVRVGEAGGADRVLIGTSPLGLLRGEIDVIRLEAPAYRLSYPEMLKEYRRQVKAGNRRWRQEREAPAAAEPVRAAEKPRNLRRWKIRRMVILGGELRADSLGPGLPPLVLPIDTSFRNIVLGGDRADPASREVQTAESHNFTIFSIFDPLARVIEVETLRLRFTWDGLVNNRVESLEIINPEIAVGPDLFWLGEYVQKEMARLPKAERPPEPWTIGQFSVRGGTVVIATHGQPDLRLPVAFTASQRDLKIATVGDLALNAAIDVVSGDLDYPEYTLEVRGLDGRLEFALPRTQPGANNLVNTLKARLARWRRLDAANIFCSVTFDQNGIYSTFGGDAYSGYVNGNVSILFRDNMEWAGSLSATSVDLAPATSALSPGQAAATGRAHGTIVAAGNGKVVRRIDGNFKLLEKGRVDILALDELLRRIPADWGALQQDLASLLVNAFRQYHYTGGEARFAWSPPVSTFRAALRGAEGARNFDLKYHHAPGKNGAATATTP